MKIYIDLKNQSILTQKSVYGKPFYIGSEYTDTIEVYFNEQPQNWNPTLTYKLANGRTIGPVYPDEGPIPIADEDGSWHYYNFVISTENGVLAVAGQLTITINVNYTNDVGLTQRKATIGNVINQVVITANYGNEKNIVVYGDDDINQLIFDYKNEIEKIGNIALLLSSKYNAFDLGNFVENPNASKHDTLNAVVQKGVYKFNYNNKGYLMIVNVIDSKVIQTIIYVDDDEKISYYSRTYNNSNWSVGLINTLAKTSELQQLTAILINEYQKKLVDAFEKGTLLAQINDGEKASIVDALNLINEKITYYNWYIAKTFTDYIANQAKADQKGNVIDETYQAKKVKSTFSGGPLTSAVGQDGYYLIENAIIEANKSLLALNNALNNVYSGSQVVGKAKADQHGNLIDTTYATIASLNALEARISKLVSNAPEAFDTLKEIADYIAQDQSGASSMTASINRNAQNIEVLRLSSATKEELAETEKLIDVKIEDAIVSKLRSDY